MAWHLASVARPVAEPRGPEKNGAKSEKQRTAWRYLVGIAAATLSCGLANFVISASLIGLCSTLALAVVGVAWYAGFGPAVVCQILAAVFLRYWLPGPVSGSNFAVLLLFLLVTGLALSLTVSLRKNRDLHKRVGHLALVAAATNDCIWEWDLKSGTIARSGNLAAFEHTGDGFKNQFMYWRDRLHPEDREVVCRSLDCALSGCDDHWQAEYRFRLPTGSYCLIADRGTIVRDRSGTARRMIGGMSDITARRGIEDRLAHDALYDSLTNLPNRQFFRERLNQALQRKPETGTIAVLFLGLDRFKTINDSLGHAAGDQVLRALAKRIELALHAGEFASRFGGDEFTILLEEIEDIVQVESAAERFLKTVAQPYAFEDHSLVVTASVGIALAKSNIYPEEVLRFADIAMYRAKSLGGRGRHEIFEATVDSRTMNVLQLESEMRRSLENHDFRVYYQPIIALGSGEISGFEALLRWQHPQRGMLLPSEFLAVAEESGLITDLGYWTIRTVCEHFRTWQTIGPQIAGCTVSVNLAGRQFREPGLVQWLQDVLVENEVDPTCMILELTENMILENNAFVSTRLEELRNIGMRLAIDDFGQGHSSFGRLQDLQVSIVKIDGSFVRRIEEGKPEIVDAIVALAKQLKLDVTAECVETAAQFEHLRRVHCTTGQGLYFSPAVTAAAAGELLRLNPSWRLPLQSAAGS